MNSQGNPNSAQIAAKSIEASTQNANFDAFAEKKAQVYSGMLSPSLGLRVS